MPKKDLEKGTAHNSSPYLKVSSATMTRQVERNATYSGGEEVLALLAVAKGLGEGESVDKEW